MRFDLDRLLEPEHRSKRALGNVAASDGRAFERDAETFRARFPRLVIIATQVAAGLRMVRSLSTLFEGIRRRSRGFGLLQFVLVWFLVLRRPAFTSECFAGIPINMVLLPERKRRDETPEVSQSPRPTQDESPPRLLKVIPAAESKNLIGTGHAGLLQRAGSPACRTSFPRSKRPRHSSIARQQSRAQPTRAHPRSG